MSMNRTVKKSNAEGELEKPLENYPLSENNKCWIFQANPNRFDASHWWHDMKLAEQWQIGKNHRDKIRNMGINAMWVAIIGEDDVWAVEAKHHDRIINSTDISAHLLSEKFDNWSVFQHKNEISENDLAVIWVSGKDDIAGVYAIARVVSDPYVNPFPTEGNIAYWVRKKDREELPKSIWLKTSICYIRVVDPPWTPFVSRSTIMDDDRLQDLIILRFFEATNLGPISPKQWHRIMELVTLSPKS